MTIIDNIVSYIQKKYGIDIRKTKSRDRLVIYLKKALIYIMRREGYQEKYVSSYLNINRTTIAHHIKDHENLVDTQNNEYLIIYNELNNLIEVNRFTAYQKILKNIVDNIESIGYNQKDFIDLFLTVKKILKIIEGEEDVL